MNGFFFDPDWINNKPNPNDHKGPSVMEILVFLICSLIVLGFIGVVVSLWVNSG